MKSIKKQFRAENQKGNILESVRPIQPSDIVRGQYRGYRQENGVAPDSQVETFAALKLSIDSWRWADVPFYIRAGKYLPVTATEILVEFKRPPQAVFGEVAPERSNYCRFRISPVVKISLGARAKIAGEAMHGEEVELVAVHQSPDEMAPYDRLLTGAMQGDEDIFVREDSIEAQWKIVDPILKNVTPVFEYDPKSWVHPKLKKSSLVMVDGTIRRRVNIQALPALNPNKNNLERGTMLIDVSDVNATSTGGYSGPGTFSLPFEEI